MSKATQKVGSRMRVSARPCGTRAASAGSILLRMTMSKIQKVEICDPEPTLQLPFVLYFLTDFHCLQRSKGKIKCRKG